MSNTITTKPGKTREGERTRVWLEGERLLAHGFTHRALVERQWSKGRLVLLVVPDWQWALLPRTQGALSLPGINTTPDNRHR